MIRTRLMIFIVLAAALALPGIARAQAVAEDRYFVAYFDNANTQGAPEGLLRIVNSAEPNPFTGLGGDVCAMIYVFRPDQQLAECCGCKVTPNGLLTISVNNNLTANPLTSDAFTRGSIFVVSAMLNEPNAHPAPKGSSVECNPSDSFVEGNRLEIWITNPQVVNNPNVPFVLTESHPSEENFSDLEATALANKCGGITSTTLGPGGSGHGLCQCPPESAPLVVDPPIIGTVSAPTSTTATLSAPTLSTPTLTTPNLSAPKLAPTSTSAPNLSTPKLSASTASSTPSTQR